MLQVDLLNSILRSYLGNESMKRKSEEGPPSDGGRYMPITECIGWRSKHKIYNFLGLSPKRFLIEMLPRLGLKLFELSVNERIADYPFVFSVLGCDKKLRILDVGCYYSKLPIELATLGHEVYGVDVLEYGLTHPNFRFIKGDIMNVELSDNFFDAITCISTIEHIGLGRYGDPIRHDGDKAAVQKMSKLLRNGGRIILSAPFGKSGVCYYDGVPLHRIYDYQRLKNLLSGLRIEKSLYLVKEDQAWVQVSLEEAEKVDGLHVGEVLADVLVVASKP